MPPPTRSAKLKIICKLKWPKIPDLDSFTIVKEIAF